MDLSGPICLSALGRECNVGDLYDYYNNRIVQGNYHHRHVLSHLLNA